jgi:hypothetical protein
VIDSFKLRRLGARTEVNEDGRDVVYDDLLSHLQFCTTGICQPIQLPRNPNHLDAVLGGRELHGGVLLASDETTCRWSRLKDSPRTPTRGS